MLSRHKGRSTWEIQGGHIEEGETPLKAVKRELYEESGAVRFDIETFCDYWTGDEEMITGANGMAFKAIIHELSVIPESEMAEVKEFDMLPNNLTYPEITKALLARMKSRVVFQM